MSEVALSHREVEWMALDQAAIGTLGHRSPFNRWPRIDDVMHALFQRFLHGLAGVEGVSARALPGAHVRVNRTVLFEDPFFKLRFDICGTTRSDMER